MSGPLVTQSEPSAADRPTRSTAVSRDVLAIGTTYLLLGLVCGVLWWLFTDPAMFTKRATGAAMGEVELARQFNADGWYAVIALVAGLLSGGVVAWWRSRDFLVTTVLLVLGAGVAAAVMAVTGHLLGPGDPEVALRTARIGDHVPTQLLVTAKAAYLMWPIAVLVGALMLLWSPAPDESGPDPDDEAVTGRSQPPPPG